MTELYLLVEGQDDGAVGRHADGPAHRCRRHEHGLFIGLRAGIGGDVDVGNGQSVVVSLAAYEPRRAVGHPADIDQRLVVGLGREAELTVLPATARQVERAYRRVVLAVGGIFNVEDGVGVVMHTQCVRHPQSRVALRGERDFVVVALRAVLPDARSVASVLLSVGVAARQPADGLSIGVVQREQSGILSVAHIVGGTLAAGLVVVQVPAYDVVGGREVGRQLLMAVHADDALGIGQLVLPADEGQHLVVPCGQLHLGSLFIHAPVAHQGACRLNADQVGLRSCRQVELQFEGRFLAVGGGQPGVGRYLEAVGVGRRDNRSPVILPTGEVIAEVLSGRQGHFVALVEEVGIGRDAHLTGSGGLHVGSQTVLRQFNVALLLGGEDDVVDVGRSAIATDALEGDDQGVLSAHHLPRPEAIAAGRARPVVVVVYADVLVAHTQPGFAHDTEVQRDAGLCGTGSKGHGVVLGIDGVVESVGSPVAIVHPVDVVVFLERGTAAVERAVLHCERMVGRRGNGVGRRGRTQHGGRCQQQQAKPLSDG